MFLSKKFRTLSLQVAVKLILQCSGSGKGQVLPRASRAVQRSHTHHQVTRGVAWRFGLGGMAECPPVEAD